ncbi:MAG: hypothetical protein ACKVH8_19545 [Pirellulales bacterium]
MENSSCEPKFSATAVHFVLYFACHSTKAISMLVRSLFILCSLLMCSGCVNTWNVPGTNQQSLKDLLDKDGYVVKKQSVLFGNEDPTGMKQEEPTANAESSDQPDDFQKRLNALEITETAKAEFLKIFGKASDEQKEEAISVMERNYKSTQPETTEDNPKEELIDSYIERLKNLPKQDSTVSAIKKLPPVTGPSSTKAISSEQASQYPRTGSPNARDLDFIKAQLATTASKIPASRYPREDTSRAELLAYHQGLDPSEASAVSLTSGIMPEEVSLQNAALRQVPNLSLKSTAREVIARRTESMSRPTKQLPGQLDTKTSQLTPNQQLVMEVVWDRGEISFQEIFREINPTSTMAKSTDTPDGGLSSTTKVKPLLLTHDEIQAVIYELEDNDWLEHQVRDDGIQYWAVRTRPEHLSQSWKETLATTIRSLESTTNGKRLSKAEQSQLKIYLRMLYLMAQRKSEAVEKVEGLPTAEQDFWANLLFGMSDYLQQSGMSDHQRNLLALRSIRRAVNNLSETSPLDVHNLHFIESVESFGRFKAFSNTQFKPNQEVLLYAEIDNLTSTQVDGEYHSTLLSTYEIFDKAGQRIDYRKFPEVKDTCNNQRRDFYVPYRLYIPENLKPGNYVLELSVRDVDSEKFGEASIEFSVAP